MGSRSKKYSRSLSIKQQEKLMQDLTDMTMLVIAYRGYVESIGKVEESKAFIKNFIEEARKKALEDSKKKVV